MATKIWIVDVKRMKYHHPAISRLLDPSQRATDNLVVKEEVILMSNGNVDLVLAKNKSSNRYLFLL